MAGTPYRRLMHACCGMLRAFRRNAMQSRNCERRSVRACDFMNAIGTPIREDEMRALLGAFAAAALFAALATPATAEEHTRTVHTFNCPGSGNTLRIIFDSSNDTAIVTRMRQPNVRLQRAASAGEGFHYTRSSNTHELTGTLQQVRWRVGNSTWDCHASG